MPYSQYYKDKVILVTGGAGAIGRNLIERLVGLNAGKIILFDNLMSSYKWNIPVNKNILFIQGDIRNDDDLRRIFHHKPGIVFHLAAFFANQNSVDYPLICEDINARGILKLLEYCQLSAAFEKFIYTNSEGGAYGKGCSIPFIEDKISFNLGSPYYISKMAGESYCYYYHSFYNLPVSVVRLFNSYGPGEVPGHYRNVIPNFIYWAMNGQPLPLTGNKNISRDFVFVSDIVEGILRAGFFNDAIGTSINIATGHETLIYEIADLVNLKTANPSGTRILKGRKWDLREKVIGDNQKCQKLLNFNPSVQLEEGLDKTILWFKDNWQNIKDSAEFSSGLNPALEVN
jgi:nucleoside-diphosphate-sugar epimerase